MKTALYPKIPKPGTFVKSWCCGEEVIGFVYMVDRENNKFWISHKPIRWGNHVYYYTCIKESTPLQKLFYTDWTPSFEEIE